MIKLTLMTLMGIAATMTIAGRDIDRAEGSDQPIPEVARLDMAETGLLTATDRKLDLDDEQGAIELALAASMHRQKAEQTVAETTANATSGSAQLWYVSGSAVNLRAGPSTANEVVGQAMVGQPAEVLAEVDGWYHIKLSDSGQDAYIYGRFLSEDRPS